MSLCCPWILKRCPHFTDVCAQDRSVSSIERWEEKILQIKTPSVYSWDPVFRIWSSWGSSLGWSVTMGEEATAHPEVKPLLCKRQDTELLHHLIPSAHGRIKEQSHYPSPPFFFFSQRRKLFSGKRWNYLFRNLHCHWGLSPCDLIAEFNPYALGQQNNTVVPIEQTWEMQWKKGKGEGEKWEDNGECMGWTSHRE